MVKDKIKPYNIGHSNNKKMINPPTSAPKNKKIIDQPTSAPKSKKIIDQPTPAPKSKKIIDQSAPAPKSKKIIDQSAPAPKNKKIIDQPTHAPKNKEIIDQPISTPRNKKGSNKRFAGVIIFFLVSFLMGFAFGLFSYHIFLNKPTKDNITNEVANNTTITDENIINNLFNQINNTTFEKVIYTYRLNGVKFEELTNDEKLYLAEIDNYTKKSVKFSELKNNLLKKYNTDFSVKNTDYNYHSIETIACVNDEYTYPDSLLDYVDNRPYIDLYKTLKLVKEDNKYYLSVVGIYHQITTSEDKYTNDTGFIYNEALSKKTTIDDLYKTNKEQFMLYTFIFNKNNDKYVIEQVKKDK